jgi:peroxiredoxin
MQKDVWERLAPKGLAVAAVSVGEDQETVREFALRKNFTFDVLVDSERLTKELLGGESIPRLVVVDRTGIIRHLGVGFDEAEFRETLKLIEGLVGSE